MTALLTTAQRAALRTLAAAAPDSAYMTISAAELRAALATIDALEAALREAAALTDRPPTAPPSGGAWLLNDAGAIVEYTHGDSADGGELRRLDLVEAGRVLIIALDEPDDTLPAGLTTLVPVAGHCRVCGCSQFNACIGDDGQPCSWAEADLCSACTAGEVGS